MAGISRAPGVPILDLKPYPGILIFVPTKGWVDGWMYDEWMDAMDERMDGRMDGRIDG